MSEATTAPGEPRLCAAVAEALQQRLGPRYQAREVTIEAVDEGGNRVAVTVHLPGPVGPPPATVREAVLAALRQAARPVKGVVLARRVGRENSAHFRTVCAGLVHEGLVVRGPGGYWLASRPLPMPRAG
jgi:hypothetical protein